MSGQLRQAACQALSDYLTPLIQNEVPNYSGSVQVGWADYADPLVYPDVVVIPGKFRRETFSEGLEDESLADRVLVNVGEMAGTVEIRAYDNTNRGRRLLEQVIWGALNTELAPGIVTLLMQPVPIGGTAWVSGSLCSFEASDAEWNEEMSFSSRRYSYMTVGCHVPDLICRTGVYDLKQLQTMISAAVSEDVSTSTFVSGTDGPIETVTPSPSGSMSNWYQPGQSP